tara:strand:+ start:183 stop:884 length:702 start_codon:yes stop_codon:yes gene_type:complete
MENQVPKHIGLIIDGNRRFSKRLMLKPWKGHEFGYKKVKKVIEWCKEYPNIKEITIYAFSLENFKRPKKEFDYLMGLFKKAFQELMTKDKERLKQIKVQFIGRIKLFPKEIQKVMQELQEKTKNNKPYTLNFAMAYSGQAEVVDATKRIVEKVENGDLNIDEINEQVFKENLDLSSEPDLVIRTSEKRLSGFLLFQSAYAEIMFVDKLWPEFEKEDFVACINEFSSRKRRFGA